MDNVLLTALQLYYADNKNSSKLLEILKEEDNKISLRIIDWFVTNYSKKKNISHAHISYLENTFGQGNLIFPTFNYDFEKLKIFDVKNSESHVGALTNFVLKLDDYNRTNTPIFSFAVDKKINPFFINKRKKELSPRMI